MNRLFYAICHRLALSRYFSKIKWSEEGVDPSMAADDMNRRLQSPKRTMALLIQF